MENNFYTYNELSQFLGVKKSTLYCWVNRKVIPFTRITGRTVIFDRNQIFEWLSKKSSLPERGGNNVSR